MNKLTGLRQIFETVRHLKLCQIYYRIYYFLHCPKVLDSPRGIRLFRRRWVRCWDSPEWLLSPLQEERHFHSLGISGNLSHAGIWNTPVYPKLWLYHLHYFDTLNARDAIFRDASHKALIHQWIKENPPCTGIGWDPYPLSLRIVNWVKWFARQPDINEAWLESLSLQAYVLSQKLEYHILGNHLLANAKALIFVGIFLQGEPYGSYLDKGLKLFSEQIHEQFLADGGHFELSPMYQSTLLWDMCDLLNLFEVSKVQELEEAIPLWRDILEKGLKWLAQMSHVDGNISFFNDAAFGMAPPLADLYNYASRFVPLPSLNYSPLTYNFLEDTGYCRININKGCMALLDLAKIGPDYLPGHAHADTLSFEMSLFGQRIFVNSGTSCYQKGQLRSYQRSTKAHNTVVVNNENSSEVWSSFRVARRAYPQIELIKSGNGSILIQASHDGYRRLPGKNIHTRAWKFTSNKVEIYDSVRGSFQHAEALFYLHPDVQIGAIQKTCQILLTLKEGHKVFFESENGTISIKEGRWYPRFGYSIPNICLRVIFHSSLLKTSIFWE